MKKLLLVLLVVIISSCSKDSKSKNNSIIGKEYKVFKEINQLENYTKVSDTIIYGQDLEAKNGILHLRDQTRNLVVFKSISRDSNYIETYKIIDTLVIPNLNKPELITIGYCQMNKDNNENIIAIVNQTDSLYVKTIKKVWLANMKSKKIERVKNLSGITCFNEWYVE